MAALDLRDLAAVCDLSAGLRDGIVEAARVMLDQYHLGTSPIDCSWQHNAEERDGTQIIWDPADAAMRTSHGNSKDATEDGAYAIAIAAVAQLGFRVIGRTQQGSGCDYFMNKDGTTFKLEVSGIAAGGTPAVRLTDKIKQGKKGTLLAPGLALVFRFREASAHSETWT